MEGIRVAGGGDGGLKMIEEEDVGIRDGRKWAWRLRKTSEVKI